MAEILNLHRLDRRALLAAGASAAAVLAAQGALAAPAPKLTFKGPIPVTPASKPYGTAMVPGSPREALVRRYDYVEEEFFLSGKAGVYGPAVKTPLAPGQITADLKPLAALVRASAPFTTRAMMLRPKDPAKFSGNVHLIAFHNLDAAVVVDKHMLRNGDVWIGLEVNGGTRFGVEQRPSGGVANLLTYDPARYAGLSLPSGVPEDWPDLTGDKLSEAFKRLSFGRQDHSLQVFLQDLYRSYAQAPDILSQVSVLLRSNAPNGLLKGYRVRRLYINGASGQSTLLSTYIDYHHAKVSQATGRPPFDGYVIRVGNIPDTRPADAAVVIIQSEAEVVDRQDMVIPPDTDQPRFRYYEIPGVGHGMTAKPLRTGAGQGIGAVVPKGVQGISDTDGGRSIYQPLDKTTLPILWAAWANLYRWVDDGLPMPRAQPITRDLSTPDGVARDQFGNALGGIRTPWVTVPDARYVARMSEKNPLAGGMSPFPEAQMTALYGSREAYLQKVDRRLEEMVAERLILAEDVPLMRLRGATDAMAVGYDP